jgi:hypothetical protein
MWKLKQTNKNLMNKEKVKEELKWEMKKNINEMVTYQTL